FRSWHSRAIARRWANSSARVGSRLSRGSWRSLLLRSTSTCSGRPSRRCRIRAMYKRILVAIENSAADQTILTHVKGLARLTGAELLLVHVADGFAARHFDDLKLRESEEMKSDRAYLEGLKQDLTAQGLTVDFELAMGDPATELIRTAEARHVDLV